jgi:hypothetical protein
LVSWKPCENIPILTLLDLNDVSALCLYNELLLFRAGTSAELTFEHPDQVMQKTLHSISDALGLDYEYWKSLKRARISKPEPESEEAGSIPAELANLDITPLEDVLSNVPDPSSDPLLYDLMNPLDFSTLSDEDGIQTWAGFGLSLGEDMPSLSNNEMLSNFDNDQQFFSPLPTPLSSSSAANEEFAAIFRDTSFFRPRRGSSKAGSRAGSGVGSRAASRAGSTKSASSERGRKVSKPASRSSSANRSVGFQEIVFNSNPSRPASRVSSGRRGPLDAMARAAVKAVKALGACWRCKWLRKDVSRLAPSYKCT